jgi:uncharacterized protein YdaU (DUF1376 family)
MSKKKQPHGLGERRRLDPMPVEAIIDHPTAMTMSTNVFGATMRVLLHYWNSDCAPLPEDDRELMLVSRSGRRVWMESRDQVMVVVRDVLPAFDRYHHWRESMRKHWADNREKGQAVKALKAIRAKQKGAQVEMNSYARKRPADPAGLPVAPLPGLVGRTVRTG